MFIVFLNINQKLPKTGPKKTITFKFVKTRVIKKKRFVATPFLPKNCVLKLSFLKLKNIQVEQKAQLKIRKKQR